MSATPPNGLASLAAQRERARRSMPAPRHPARTEDNSPGGRRAAGVPRPDIPATDAEPVPVLGDPGATIKVTLYVDRETDAFLEAARVEGLTSRPKVDVSRSAVVRLALRRLMDEMSPAEVKALLAGRAVRSGPGRKRR